MKTEEIRQEKEDGEESKSRFELQDMNKRIHAFYRNQQEDSLWGTRHERAVASGASHKKLVGFQGIGNN